MAVVPDPARPAPSARGARPARTALVVGLLGAATVAAAVALLLSAGGQKGAAPSSAARVSALGPSPAALARETASPPPAAPSPAAPPAAVAKSTLLATMRGAAPRYASPGQLDNGAGAGTVPFSWYERPSVLPVVAAKPGWVEVRLAQRPNESTAWVPASDVTLSRTPDEIVVDLATTTVSLYDDGQLVFSAPAGVGTPDDPTPTGQFFVAFHEQPPAGDAGYGPFILVTSAHSPAISDWEGSGDAVIGIHGPLGEDAEIGTSGARISHGCIRLHDQALERLAEVAPGTPIDIVG
jgi:lipoprotein-anchoring transpeptidase ErfK/SrfK